MEQKLDLSRPDRHQRRALLRHIEMIAQSGTTAESGNTAEERLQAAERIHAQSEKTLLEHINFLNEKINAQRATLGKLEGELRSIGRSIAASNELLEELW